MAGQSNRRWVGSSVGILTFLAGVALLLFVFKLAYDMFAIAPSQAIGTQPGKALDVNVAVQSLLSVIFRVIMLVVMAGMGGAIASRGLRLYGESSAVKVASEVSE